MPQPVKSHATQQTTAVTLLVEPPLSHICIMIKQRICYYLISVFQMCLGTMVMMIEYGYVMNKTDLGV
jgi:hypothetical protein